MSYPAQVRGRAGHWEPLCAADPIPGEPDRVKDGGGHYSEMAEVIDQQINRLKGIVSSTLQGDYVQTLTDAAEGLQEGLGAIRDRYRVVGGRLTHWGGQLEGFQEDAEALRRAAVSAQGDMDANHVIAPLNAVVVAPPDPAVAAANARKESRYEDASRDLRIIQDKLADLTGRRDAAARLIAGAIRTSNETLADGGWDNFQDFFKNWVHKHKDGLTKLCSVLGYIAMAAVVVVLVVALAVPGLNIVAGTALATGLAGLSTAATVAGVAATAASLAVHTAQYSTGDASLVDIGVDAISLASFGTGRFITTGFKAGKLVGKVLGKGEGFGKQFGGALERLTTQASTAGAEARGAVARAGAQKMVTGKVTQANARLAERVGNRSWLRRALWGKVDGWRDAIQIKQQVGEINKLGEKAMDAAYNGAKDAYATKTITMDPVEKVFLGGSDPGIGASRLTARDAAHGFTPESTVGLAAAKADAKGAQAAHLMATSTVDTIWSFWADKNHMKWYDDFKGRWTKEGGYL